MSIGDIERPRELVTRPATNAIAIASEQARTQAEIQAALTIAQRCPRDEQAAIDGIATACQRPRLAELAAYAYSRGGTEIYGPSIKLLECIAGKWGNLQFGFRELEQKDGESTVEAYAWDLQANTKRALTFTVPHAMKSGHSLKKLTDPRDIYEWVANNAQRRVRTCLEAVIPRDVVEVALEQTEETLKANDPVTPEKIQKLVTYFEEHHGIVKAQIEARLGRRLDTLTPAQMIGLRRICTSLRDGMSKPEDWFKPVPTEGGEAKPAESAKEALKRKKAEAQAPQPTESTTRVEGPQPGERDSDGNLF